MAQQTETVDKESCSTCEPDAVEDATGILSALLASSCCWIPAFAALAGFSAVGAGVVMMKYHTPLALVALCLLGVSWWLFLRKRWNGAVPWNSGYAHWIILSASSVVVLLYSIIGWLFPSVFIYLM
ncbi:MAG: hypothetical protein ABEK50_08805 [bacterium]